MLRKKPLIVSKKRKTSVARVLMKPGKGIIRINNMPLDIAIPEVPRAKIHEVLSLSGDAWKGIDFAARLQGGGIMGQADALRMAIAEGLVKWTKNKKLRALYIERFGKSLFWDSRRKESKKFGGPRARRRRQKSYR